MDIIINFEMNRKDVFYFNKHIFFKKYFKKVFIISSIFLFLLLWMRSIAKVSMIDQLIFSAVYISVNVLLIFFNIYYSKFTPKKAGAILGHKEFHITDNGISYTQNNANGFISWDAIIEVQACSNAYYLFVDNVKSIVIPKRSFFNEKDLSEFSNYLIKLHVKK